MIREIGRAKCRRFRSVRLPPAGCAISFGPCLTSSHVGGSWRRDAAVSESDRGASLLVTPRLSRSLLPQKSTARPERTVVDQKWRTAWKGVRSFSLKATRSQGRREAELLWIY